MTIKGNEAAALHRARKGGLDVPKQKPGPPKGYKQSPELIEKRKRVGAQNKWWRGDAILQKSGRSRAGRLYSVSSCEKCGEGRKRIDRHHIDGDTRHNDRLNIKFLCRKCHMTEDGRLDEFARRAKNIIYGYLSNTLR